jgi:hypothetical protein
VAEHAGHQQHRGAEQQPGRADVQEIRAGRGEQPRAAAERVGQAGGGHHGAGAGIAERPGQQDAGHREHGGDGQRDQGRQHPRPTGHRQPGQAEDQRDRGHGQAAAAGRGAAPGPPGAARASGDHFHHVVVRQLRPVLPGRAQMQQLPVAYALGRQIAVRLEDPAGGPPQHPSALAGRGVAERAVGVPQQVRQQLGDQHVVGQREIHPALGRRHGHPGQAGTAQAGAARAGAAR